MKKEDLRVIKTKQAIKESFIELVEVRGYNRVSVTDIIKKANINRNTFYLHYENKDDLVRKIIEECSDRAKQVITENKELLTKIAEALLEKEVLTSEEIYEIAGMKDPMSEEKEDNEEKKTKKVKEEKIEETESEVEEKKEENE